MKLLLTIDRLNAWVGKSFAWCILIMTFGVSYEVLVRYVFRAPTTWAFDVSYIMYGTLFMMAGAYTLSRNGHVRGDFVYRLWAPRRQATVELVLYILFFFPGMLALFYAGAGYAMDSWRYNEVSINSPSGIPIFQLKTVIPVAAFFMLLQGVAQVARCLICIRTGAWPQQLHDVEETEVVLMRQQEEEQRRRAGGAHGEAPR